MRMEVEKIICDRCGKEIKNNFVYGEFSLTTSCVGVDGFSYLELCARCMKTVERRLIEAGPLRGAPPENEFYVPHPELRELRNKKLEKVRNESA